jgi:hypothetical protein
MRLHTARAELEKAAERAEAGLQSGILALGYWKHFRATTTVKKA